MIIKLEGIKLIRGASCDSYAQQLAQRRNSLSRGLNVHVRVDGSKLSLRAEEDLHHGETLGKLMYHHAQVEIERRAVRRYECARRRRDRVTRVVAGSSCVVRIKRTVRDLFRQKVSHHPISYPDL